MAKNLPGQNRPVS